MSKERLYQARELIKAGRYDEARKILRAMPNDPTAFKWLKQLETIAPESRSARATRTQPKAGGSKRGGMVTLLAAVVVIVVLVGVGGAFVLQNQGGLAAVFAGATPTPSITPGGPTLTPTPTPAPTNTPTPLPCDVAVWWGMAQPHVTPFMSIEIYTLDGAVARIGSQTLTLQQLQNSRNTFNNMMIADCEEVAAIHGLVADAMDSALGWFQSPIGSYTNIEQLIGVSEQEYQDYLINATTMLDNLAAIPPALAAHEISYTPQSQLIRDYMTTNTAECPRVRWMLIEYNMISYFALRFSNIAEQTQPNFQQGRTLIFDMSDYRRSLRETEHPDCVRIQYDLLNTTYNQLIQLLQNVFTSDSAYQTALSANDLISSMIRLDASMRHIDGIGILEGLDFWGR